MDFRCPPNVEFGDQTKKNGCQTGYYCNTFLYCSRCANGCADDEYCNNDAAACQKKNCCAPSGTCASGDDGCSNDKYCFKGECKPKCDCLFTGDTFNWRCDATTNYRCEALVCDRGRVHTIPEYKQLKVEFDQTTEEAKNAVNNTYTRKFHHFTPLEPYMQVLYPETNAKDGGGTYFSEKYIKACQSYFQDGFNYTVYNTIKAGETY